MSTNARKVKPNVENRRAKSLPISPGVQKFDPDKAVVDKDFELEEFLRWRDEMRKAEKEAMRDCPL